MSFLALFWWNFFLLNFFNSRSILKIKLCNWNLTKLDILTLLTFDCRAWALKLSEHLKKTKKKPYFCLHFGNSNYWIIFPHFLFSFFFFHILNLILLVLVWDKTASGTARTNTENELHSWYLLLVCCMGRDCLRDSEEQHTWAEMSIICFAPLCPRGSLVPGKIKPYGLIFRPQVEEK